MDWTTIPWTKRRWTKTRRTGKPYISASVRVIILKPKPTTDVRFSELKLVTFSKQSTLRSGYEIYPKGEEFPTISQ